MIRFITYILLLFFSSLSINLLGQTNFVDFETTNKTFTVCQNKTLGVIATLNPNYQELTTYKWINDSNAISDIRNGIAIVNTSSPGEKSLKFSLKVNDHQKLDTITVINVLPLPDVSVSYDGKSLKSTNKNETNALHYRWIFNNELLPSNESIILNPSKGSYRAVITDSNGCTASSEVFTVK